MRATAATAGQKLWRICRSASGVRLTTPEPGPDQRRWSSLTVSTAPSTRVSTAPAVHRSTDPISATFTGDHARSTTHPGHVDDGDPVEGEPPGQHRRRDPGQVEPPDRGLR
jgi:hypothetical protein